MVCRGKPACSQHVWFLERQLQCAALKIDAKTAAATKHHCHSHWNWGAKLWPSFQQQFLFFNVQPVRLEEHGAMCPCASSMPPTPGYSRSFASCLPCAPAADTVTARLPKQAS